MYPAWIPVPATAGATGGPSAGGAYAGVGAYPGYGYPAQPVVNAPRVGRSRAVFRVLVLLVFVVLVGVGAFLNLSNESAQGLGSGTHSVSAPAAVGGFAQNTNVELQGLGQAFRATVESSSSSSVSGLQQAVIAFYGSTDGTGSGTSPEYMVVAASYGHALSDANLTTLGTGLSGFDFATASVQSQDGVDFHCGAFGATVLASGCMWVDGNVFGMVLGAPSLGQASTLVAAEGARNSVEG
jgi:hypothetical protein